MLAIRRLKINMESNITDRQYLGTDLQLSQPHFDEEATLLSARRVVPLGELRTEPRLGKRLAFALAIIVGGMTGVFGARLIYKQRDQRNATTIVKTGASGLEPAAPKDQSLSGPGGTTSNSASSSVEENVDDVTTRDVPKDAATETEKPASLLSLGPGQANRAGNDSDERELRRTERMEARRLKRNAEHEAKREGRGHKGQPSDGLLRIREIFEGSGRP